MEFTGNIAGYATSVVRLPFHCLLSYQILFSSGLIIFALSSTLIFPGEYPSLFNASLVQFLPLVVL